VREARHPKHEHSLATEPIAEASAGDEEYSVGCGIAGDDELHVARCGSKASPDDRQGEVDHVEVEDRNVLAMW
jgi:hypothetical protein